MTASFGMSKPGKTTGRGLKMAFFGKEAVCPDGA